MWKYIVIFGLTICQTLTALPPDTSVPFILNSNPCLVDPSICFEVPSAPRNLRLNQLRRALPPYGTDPSAEYAVLELAWDPPERSHGDLRGYQVSHRLIGPPELVYSQRDATDTGPQKPIRRNVTQTAYTSTLADGLSKFMIWLY
ncbi:putative receptor tyrosine phosphatase type r2a [Fasciola gigantica]|uniref:Putative receptor tyrosine phosphatase type r2a n=1 Tax=Fasciola gigantica TaxID=46835 RepID=A0A504Z1M6_FASGI|nr:putative receptor tyrosine phosphatase type r2a [Fasciola gigantica]